MRKILLIVIFLIVSLDGFAQEENHQYKHHTHPEYAKIKNPIKKNKESIAQGRRLYEKYCIVCHGEAGKGGTGPNLLAPVRIHGNTDGEMFHVITDGAVRTTMKGFRKELSDEMRWHLVNYITSLKKKQISSEEEKRYP